MSQLGDSYEGFKNPECLKFNAGDTVLVVKDEIGKIFTFIGGSRDQDTPMLSQVFNVDSGEIH